MIVGIDASNLVEGGGKTHLVNLLTSLQPGAHDVRKVVVFGSDRNLLSIEDAPWLLKRNISHLNGGLFARLFWVTFKLNGVAKKERIDILLIPGGIFTCCFHPSVVICQNLLPFEPQELRRYRISFSKLRLVILRVMYSFSLKSAQGVIFLTEYARKKVLGKTGQSKTSSLVVRHGVSTGFLREPQLQRSIDDYSIDKPFRLIYISSVDVYKNHPKVVEAVSALRSSTGWPIVIDFLGKPFPQASKELTDCLDFHDPAREWAIYHGWRDEPDLNEFLRKSDLGLFASSCENLPISLLVTMASGLPIVSSDLGPMPEILGDSAMYFNPYEAKEIASTLEKAIGSKDARQSMAKKSYERSLGYDWSKCSHDTFSFLSRICKNSSYSTKEV